MNSRHRIPTVRTLSQAIFIVFLCCTFTSARASCGPSQALGHVEEVTGDVRAGDVKLHHSDTICVGSKLVTRANARVTIRMNNSSGAVIRLGPDTTAIAEPPTAARSLLIRITRGLFGFFSAEPTSLSIETPHMTGAVRGTEFTLSVAQPDTVLAVLEGKVEATHPPTRQSVLVEAGTQVRATATTMGTPLRVQSAEYVAWSLYFPWALRDGTSNRATALGEAQKKLASGDSEGALQLLSDQGEKGTAARAGILLSLGNIDAAIDALDTSCTAPFDLDKLDAYLLRALAAVVTDDGNAQACLQASETVAPADTMLSLVRSYYLQGTGDVLAALTALPAASQAEPLVLSVRRAELLSLNGQVDDAQMRAKKALARLRKADVRGPLLSYALTIDGLVSIEQRAPKELATQFDEAIAENPRDPNARRARALVAVLEGDDVVVRRELQVAIALNPNDAGARTDLGRYYVRNGRQKLAQKELAYAATLDANDPTPHHHLALSVLRAGDPNAALNHADSARELSDRRRTTRSASQLRSDRVLRGLNLSLAFRELELTRLSWLSLVRVIPDATLNGVAWSHLGAMMYESYYGSSRRDVRLTAQMLSDAVSVDEFDYFFPPNIDSLAPTTLFESSVSDFQRYSRHGVTGALASVFADSENDHAAEVVGRQLLAPWSFSVAGQRSSREQFDLLQSDDTWTQVRAGARRDLAGGSLLSLDIRKDQYDYKNRAAESDPTNFSALIGVRQSREQVRLGSRWARSPNSALLGVVTLNRTDVSQDRQAGSAPGTKTDTGMFDLQYRYQGERSSIVTGFRTVNQSTETDFDSALRACPGSGNDPDDPSIGGNCVNPEPAVIVSPGSGATATGGIPSSDPGDTAPGEQLPEINRLPGTAIDSTAYLDATITVSPSTQILAGLSYEHSDLDDMRRRWLPRFGAMWSDRKGDTLTTARAVAYRHMAMRRYAPASLKPGLIFGFSDQLVVPGRTEVDGLGFAVDRQWGTRLNLGVSVDRRDRLIREGEQTAEPSPETRDQLSLIADWRPNAKVNFSALLSQIEVDQSTAAQDVNLRTRRVFVTARYRHTPSLSAEMTLRKIWQSGTRSTAPVNVDSTTPVLIDVSIKYRLPGDGLSASLGVSNITNQRYPLYSFDRETPEQQSGRRVFASLSWTL